MRRLLIVFVLVLGLFMVKPAQAQSIAVIESMDIGLWPEYDRADVLVIYRITLPSDVALPTQMSIRIPRDAGAPYNLAMKDMDGLLYNIAYTTEFQNEWIQVTFSTPSTEVQIEYYDPNLIKNGSVRDFEYVWPGDFTVNNLTIAIQQPVNASDMKILPDFGAGIKGEDGLVYYTNMVGSVNAGTPFTVRFSYTKPDDELSFGSQAIQPVQPASTSEAGRIDATTISPWIIGGVGLFLLAGGLIWFGVTRKQISTKTRTGKRHHRTAGGSPAKPEPEDTHYVYCSQCGRRAPATDAFCRSCGNRLRSN